MKNSANRSEKTGQFLFVCLFVLLLLFLGEGCIEDKFCLFFIKNWLSITCDPPGEIGLQKDYLNRC